MRVRYNGHNLVYRVGWVCKVVSIDRGWPPIYTLLFEDGLTHQCLDKLVKPISFSEYYEAVRNI